MTIHMSIVGYVTFDLRVTVERVKTKVDLKPLYQFY